MPELDPDEYADYYEEQLSPRTGGGGGKTTWGGKGRQKSKQAEVRQGQQQNLLHRREHATKSPTDEVDTVLSYLNSIDRGSSLMPILTRYINWLKRFLNDPDSLTLDEHDLSNWEKFTTSVKAGGAGRQTSRNGRARTHLLTGIRATAMQSRQAGPNEAIVMDKLHRRLLTHLNNWRTLMHATPKETLTDYRIEDTVLKRLTD